MKTGDLVKVEMLGIITNIAMKGGRNFYTVDADGNNYCIVEGAYLTEPLKVAIADLPGRRTHEFN